MTITCSGAYVRFLDDNAELAAARAFLGALRYARRERRIVRMTIDAARRGRRARFLPTVRWEDHFARPVEDVRREMLAA